MRKNLGSTRFEFYFVVSVIGLIVFFALQRYSLLTEETKRLTFEALAKNFNAAVYNQHARWIIAQQQPVKISQINMEGVDLYFSPQGWPLAAMPKSEVPASVLKNCLSLWKHLLQNPPSISYNAELPYEPATYHLTITSGNSCRFELITKSSQEYYFDYSSADGKVTIHSSAFNNATSNNPHFQ